MNSTPYLTVIVPVLNGRDLLPITIGALLASDLPRRDWELLVIDDGSTDGTRAWASARADRVLSVPDGPKGPGFARNLGAANARGEVVVLVDADVRVHADSLRRIQDHFKESSDVGAVFGAYDAHPASQDFLSQYRNLYHRFVHLRGAGDAETFWAGCGGVRRALFLEVGGFDTVAYPRPQIEDIELGYRIRDAGYRIVLDPNIQASHLKTWTLYGIIKTDLFDRGVPWMELLLADGPGRARAATLNVTSSEKLKIALMGSSVVGFLAAIIFTNVWIALLAITPLVAIVGLTAPVYKWFAEVRGWTFAIRTVPMTLLYYAISGFAVVIALGRHLIRSRS